MLKTFSKGGIHPPDNKLSAEKAIEVLPPPEMVSIPISQHIGAPAKVVVKKNDKVKVGQIIAESGGFVSANIHSSVSGTVLKIEETFDASGYKRMSVTIKVEGDEWLETIDRSREIVHECLLSAEEIIAKITTAGIVGLGGATFPTQVKLMVPRGMTAEVLVINGVECEPYLTADDRLMLEKGEEILVGVSILMKALNVNKAIVGIENNKLLAIANMEKLAKKFQGISIQPLKVSYPQGGEKQLIKACINREVPSGGLPISVGSVVQNVGTAFAVYEAVQKNKPLFERVVTVTGKSVKKPANFLARIGTPLTNLIEAAGGLPDDTGKIVSGGPMMGKALKNAEVPMTKGTSGVLILPTEEAKRKTVQECIRCAKCVSACPMGLEPYLMMPLSERKIFDKLEKERVMDCIECGSCSYTCPSNRPLLDYIRLGKASVGAIMRSRKK